MGKMKRGPKPRQVTQELLEQIEHHAARGLSQKQICDALWQKYNNFWNVFVGNHLSY